MNHHFKFIFEDANGEEINALAEWEWDYVGVPGQRDIAEVRLVTILIGGESYGLEVEGVDLERVRAGIYTEVTWGFKELEGIYPAP